MSAIHHVDDAPGYPAPHSPYSHAVVANGFVFVSGQIPVRPGGGPMEVVGDTMQEQTRQALRNVQAILEAAGSSLDRVVKVTVLLARPDLYREMNEAYAEFFPRAEAGAGDGPLRGRHPRRARRHRGDRARLRACADSAARRLRSKSSLTAVAEARDSAWAELVRR
jgi:2-iminobutanoate/2-iminopropanoate deaminase